MTVLFIGRIKRKMGGAGEDKRMRGSLPRVLFRENVELYKKIWYTVLCC